MSQWEENSCFLKEATIPGPVRYMEPPGSRAGAVRRTPVELTDSGRTMGEYFGDGDEEYQPCQHAIISTPLPPLYQ